MPIRPENKDRYPKNWPEISRRIRQRAGNRCEGCGVENYAYGGRAPDGTWHKSLPLGANGVRLEWPQPGDYAWCEGYPHERLRIVRIILTVAHLNHKPEDCRDENLKAWCQRCHNNYDAAERRKGIRQRSKSANALADLFDAPLGDAR